ncbi:MAG: hypothetical protein B7X86_01100 [Sphingobacteriales bacterium 17-39-43]|uniref:SDR family NAD(P)-dependent oxidoreductase n=1 Tax=Daejeonella sp. TaxID=2805397 RepID=UPI000BD4D028|nr:SDR family NAD(P)-dependent oxidoreductase [Daejeonella sp.]OYZ32963.1 MAG: hypothetical protein B7Y24_01105 [Sphingobacteriales bacterium 16-39-50]OZA26373.1 MAG: hypothetical protein B7X86_01100 [Sphingobacteriales bacterium 17-39-43]HQT21504.1 SDR family NAD(P)-dependent oxidoreductase [Daejeonella sp.]HQT56235.1 SDR family NAD(P)-dependent oxidoreductase [Daejeonella sp.]
MRERFIFHNYEKYKNVVSILLERHNDSLQKQLTFVKDSQTEDSITYSELINGAKKLLSYIQAKGIKKGDELIIQLEDNRRFLIAFTACLLGNIIAVPLVTGTQDEHKKKVKNVWAKMKSPYLLGDTEVLKRLEDFFSDPFHADSKWWKNIQHTVYEWPSTIHEVADAEIDENALSNDIAYLQFSSGSTGDPKGVIVSHANILHNTDSLLNSSESSSDETIVSWLPLSHDMGLVGCFLAGILGNQTLVLIPTNLFIRNPIIWMEKIHQHRGNISFSPNFGYKYFLQEWQKKRPLVNWDLSCLRIIYNGAEQISPVIINDFILALEEQSLRKTSMMPCYGLAEATLAVSFHQPGTPVKMLITDRLQLGIGNTIIILSDHSDKSISLVSCGKPIQHVQVRISSEKGVLLPANTIGLIEIKGANVTEGYYQEESNQPFSPDQWLFTGDIGFLHDDELYVVGRFKEMIIINGVNYYPYDLEKVLEATDSQKFALTKVAVAGILLKDQNQESLIVFVTFRSNGETFKPIEELVRRTIMKHFGLVVSDVVAVKRIPKTTSGKLQRRKLAEDYIINLQPKVIDKHSPTTTGMYQEEKVFIQTIHSEILKLYGFTDIKNDQALVEQGFDSLRGTELITALNKILGINLSPTIVYEYPTITELANYLTQIKSGSKKEIVGNSKNLTSYEPVAIIGMSCVFPGGANSPEQLWDILMSGTDTVKEVPAERWDAQKYYDADYQVPGKMSTKNGSFIDNVQDFDAAFFGISPREAESMDPQQRLLLEVSFQALQTSRYTLKDIHGSNTGVFIGFSHSDYNNAHIYSGDLKKIDAYSLTGTICSTAAGRLSYFYNLTGPALIIDTACSSSLVAIHNACRSLQYGDCNMALAGGVNLILTPESSVALTKVQALSPDGRCKTFDEKANGYGRGEGCGIIILKRLRDAEADGDNIMGVIRSTAINHDGKSNGLTAPNGLAQQSLLQKAISISGIAPEDITYVEAHGTGTPLGDPLEMQAVNMAYQSSKRKEKLLIGSIKSNIGHLESAAGIAGLIKVLLSFRHREIPGNLHFENPNPLISWNDVDVEVVHKNRKLDNKRLIAGLSSFGFSGTNSHLIVEEAPAEKGEGINRSYQACTLSAHTEQALKQMALNLALHLQNPKTDIGALCYHLNRSNNSFSYNWHAVVKDKEELLHQLAGLDNDSTEIFHRNDKPQGLIAFQFTGQGAQYIGMGKELYEEFEVYRNTLDECDRIYRQYNEGISIRSVILQEDSNKLIDQTKFTQPAIFCTAYALTKLFESFGIKPDVVLGHSVGEIAAICVAEMISLEDGIRLISQRANLMQKLPEGGGMMSILATEDEVLTSIEHLKLPVAIAGINSPQQTVVSGSLTDLQQMKEEMQAKGFIVIPLTVSHAFHSHLMQPITEELLLTTKSIEFKVPVIPVISNVTGSLFTEALWNDPEYIINHVLKPVQFSDSLRTMEKLGCSLCIEIGPQPVLTNLTKQVLPEFKGGIPTLRKGQSSTSQFLLSLCSLQQSGKSVNWKQGEAEKNHTYTILPLYPFQRKTYWKELFSEKHLVNDATPIPSFPAGLSSDVLYDVSFETIEKPVLIKKVEKHRVIIIYDEQIYLSRQVQKGYSDVGTPSEILHINDLDNTRSFHEPSLIFYIANAGFDSSSTINYNDLRNAFKICKGFELLHSSKVIFLTNNVHAEEKVTPVNLNNSLLWGFTAALQFEYPQLSLSVLDVNKIDENMLHTIIKYALQIPIQLIINHDKWTIPRLKPIIRANKIIKFKSDAAYVVTGGFGSLGKGLISWMIQKGACNIIVIGRSNLTDANQKFIHEWQKQKIKIQYIQADVSDLENLKSKFRSFESSTIRGVFHTAALLNDKLLQTHDLESFESIFPGKVQGAWNLHQLSKLWHLDHFVLFSSTVSLLGNIGQTNYAAANYFLNSLASFRQKQQLPALSICWGPWKNSKMTKGMDQKFEEMGIFPFSADTGFNALEMALTQKNSSGVLAAIQVQPDLVVNNGSILVHSMFPTEWHLNTREVIKESVMTIFNTTDQALIMLEELAREVLKLEPDDSLNTERPYFEIGFDSIMLNMLQTKVLQTTGINISITQFFKHPSLIALAAYLKEFSSPELAPVNAATHSDSTLTISEELRKEVSKLSDDDITALLNKY